MTLVIFSLVISLITCLRASQNCPWPYVFEPTGYCLLYSIISKTWNEARQECALVHGHLVDLKTPQLSNGCRNLATSAGGHKYWVGLTDMLQEGQYYWSDGEPLSWADWDPGQPNDNDHSQNCAVYFVNVNTIQDKWCTETNDYICQYKGCLGHRTLALMGNTTSLTNVEVSVSITTEYLAECASTCYRQSVCDGIAYHKSSSRCRVLNLRDGIWNVDSSITSSEVYFFRK